MRRALVIGAGGAIGHAVAHALARDGCRLVLSDADEAALERVRADVAASAEGRDDGPVAAAIGCDVAERAQVESLVAEAEGALGRLEVLVNCAGVAGRGPIDEVGEALWDHVIAVNLSGTFWACRYALPALRRAGGGTIVNVASVAGLREQPGSAIYSASKAGVVGLSRTLAAELIRERVRVFAVCPPAVDTPMVARAFADAPDPDAARAAYEATQPAGRLPSPDDVAATVALLAGPAGAAMPYSPEPFVV